jgi:nitroreductase/FMN reductase [NAD(P)H]
MKLTELLSERYGSVDELADVNNPVLQGIAARGSCRNFRNTPVDSDLINLLCAVALASPTKSDLQQRDIVILEAPSLRNGINSLFPNDKWIAGAPAMLVFCGNNRRQRQISNWREKPFANDHLDAFFNASVDAAIALSAFIIAAESEGLGCCPISAIRNHAGTVSDLLCLPEHVFPIAGLALGWPDEEPRVSMRLPLSVTVHRNQFEEQGIEDKVHDYDVLRQQVQPYDSQRYTEEFGIVDSYGWSEDKARQYAKPERQNFGSYIRDRGFNLE